MPQLLDARDAIVRPIAASTCDLDQAIVRGMTPFEGPFAIGHECVAEVTDIGDQVRDLKPGDIVAVPWHIACGECDRCRAGLTASCRNFPKHAMFGHPIGGVWGGLFDDFVRVQFASNMLVKVPDGVDTAAVASAGDNLSIAWEVLHEHLERKPGADVLVLGGSPSIGLYVADVAKALGAGRVVYADRSNRRLEVARKFGVEVHKGPPDESLGEFDVTIDASVNPDWLRKAMSTMVPEGFCESVGIYFKDIPFPVWEMYMRSVRFRIARGNARMGMPFVLKLTAKKCIHPEHVTTAIHAWQEAPEALVASAKPVFVRDRAMTSV